MDSELREQVIARSFGRCEWPECRIAGQEIAHLHSRGMGGNREARDVAENLMWLCSDHARISDGEYGSGGSAQYTREHLRLFGGRFLDMPNNMVAFERAEALAALIR